MRVLSSALGSSPRLPVLVCSTVIQMTPIEVFLDSVGLASTPAFRWTPNHPLEL